MVEAEEVSRLMDRDGCRVDASVLRGAAGGVVARRHPVPVLDVELDVGLHDRPARLVRVGSQAQHRGAVRPVGLEEDGPNKRFMDAW